jgi:hypothetical protein
MSKSAAIYYEAKIAERLGITRDQIRFVREQALKEKKHWRLSGRDVVYTDDGVKKFLRYLAVDLSAADLNSCLVPVREKQKGAAPKNAPATGTIELTVKRCFANPKLLLATDSAGNEVRVRVPRNRNFKVKMKLHAQRVNESLYKMVGRCPRYRGRY